MKESIGGTWLFVIVIAFIVLFTTFVSVSTNYSRCFKIKDDILDRIETAGGVNETSLTDIKAWLKGIGYDSVGTCPRDGGCWTGFSVYDDRNVPAGYGSQTNFCVKKTEVVKRISDACRNKRGKCTEASGTLDAYPSAYYAVAVFFRLDWPIIRQIFNVKITGETTTILNPKDIKEVEEQTHCMRGK